MIQNVAVPFADLSVQWQAIKQSVMPELERLFDASAFCLGPWALEFERQIAEYLEVDHAVAVSSGTAALHAAVVAAGIGPGDKVLVPSHSFIGTIWGLLYERAVPIFCDVDPRSGTIDVEDAERRMQDGVKAVMPVHLYGQPADMCAVMGLADRHGLIVIEDAAQAIGASHRGRMLGTIGTSGCFSFYPGKNLGAAGEGGLIVTSDAAAAKKLRALRDHGQSERYIHGQIGYNYRMDGIQALVLSQKLPFLDRWTEQRQVAACRYSDALTHSPLLLPLVVNGDHVFHLYVVRTPYRDELRQHLDDYGIQTGLHYPMPLHRQPCLPAEAAGQGPFPITEEFATQCLSLPLFAGMTVGQQDHVIAQVLAFFAARSRK